MRYEKVSPDLVKTGRKITKLTCDYCDYVMIFDRRKRDKKKPQMMKHIRSHNGI